MDEPSDFQLGVAVARIEERLGSIEESQRRHEETLEKVFTQAKETNGRVRVLEVWRARSMGAVAVLIGLVPVLTGTVTAVIVTQVT